ncbi:hypothetical protein PRUPE_1G339300 [Prunus persica]|uniref:Uncharacterized protein n=1 Tax=Prunus persica TaxID=3760 RepID=A0A251R869_PRUPE|nr:hypothetical protein PRUPE_1G339300 [Prunus persica]
MVHYKTFSMNQQGLCKTSIIDAFAEEIFHSHIYSPDLLCQTFSDCVVCAIPLVTKGTSFYFICYTIFFPFFFFEC